MRRLVLAAVCAAAPLWVIAQQHNSTPQTVQVQILAINDLHGNLEPPKGNDGLVNGVPAGGAEYLATHLKHAEADNPRSMLVGAGDLMGASPLLSAAFHDEPTIEALNAMGMAVTALGNHELDHGPAELNRRLRDNCLQQEDCAASGRGEPARYEYLAANVERDNDPQRSILQPTSVRIIGGVKVGFIGELLEAAPSVIAAKAIQGLRFENEAAIANAAAAKLEREGVHAIVLLTHEGGYQHPASGQPEINGCANFSGEIKDVVEKLSPSIKLIISGHTHVFYNCEIAGHTLTSAGAYGRMFTRATLTIDRKTDRVLSVRAVNEVVTRDVPKDPAQTAILDKYRPLAAKITDTVVGSTSADIRRRPNSAGESALGDVIADAELAATSSPEAGGSMIAFMNLGGIRAELVRSSGADAKRDVTYGDLYAIQPFSNQLMVVSVTGDVLRRVLEQQFKSEGSENVLQVSSGFTYKYRRDAAPGQHIVEGSMTLNGRPIAATDVLRITASDFVLNGGGGLIAFREARKIAAGPVDLEALVSYFKSHSPVAPGKQDRILRVDGKNGE